MKYFWGFGCLLALAFCLVSGCAVSEQAILAERTGFPMRFVLDKGRDLKETVSGNTFVATLPGVHPVFGEALTIRVRGLQAESIREKDPQKAALAFDQRLAFRRSLDDAPQGGTQKPRAWERRVLDLGGPLPGRSINPMSPRLNLACGEDCIQ